MKKVYRMTRQEYAEWFSLRKNLTHELNVVLDSNWKLVPNFENVVDDLSKQIRDISLMIDGAIVINDVKDTYIEKLPPECKDIPMLPYKRQRSYCTDISNKVTGKKCQGNSRKHQSEVLFHLEDHSLTEIRYSVNVENKPLRPNQKETPRIPVGKFRWFDTATKNQDNRVYYGMTPAKYSRVTPTWNIKGYEFNIEKGEMQKSEHKEIADSLSAVFAEELKKLLG